MLFLVCTVDIEYFICLGCVRVFYFWISVALSLLLYMINNVMSWH